MKANLELRIEKVMFDGLGDIDTARLRGTVERELRFLLADRGLPDSLARSSNREQSLDGGTFRMISGHSEAGVATQIARAVYRGLNR